MRSPSEAWFCAMALFVGCAEPLPLEGRHCPCAAGYHCCESGNVCQRDGETCPSWKSLDEAALDALDFDGIATGWTFEVAPDGTPYLVVMHCNGPDCYEALRRVPTVMRYENEAWTTLPSEGLPETGVTPELIVEANGTLHLLIDVTDEEHVMRSAIISSFDGVRWEERTPPLLGEVASSARLTSGPFEIDHANRLLTALLDFSEVDPTLTILRLENSSWQALGTGVRSMYRALQLALRDDSVCISYTDLTDTASIGCFDGLEWTTVRGFDGYLAPGFFIGHDGTFYVARQEFVAGVVIHGKGDTWTELPPVECQQPELAVTRDGHVFLAGVSTEIPTRLAFWDEKLDAWGYFTLEGIRNDAFVFPVHSRFEVAEPGKRPYLGVQFYVSDTDSLLRVWKHE